jgi:frataxin-like iron-binding protein CyaY
MKTLTFILTIVVASVALAEEPDELVRLRTTYDNSLRSKFQNVGKLYHDQLVELKKNYMEAQNLEGAVAVDKEIKKLREAHGKMVVKVSELQEKTTNTQEKESPLNGVWIHSNKKGKHTFFLKDNKMVHWAGGVGEVTYTNQTIVIRWAVDGWTHKLTQDPANPDLLTGVNNKGTKLRYIRYKW